ncbi:MAG: hypothetical protein ACLTBD_09215 [Clostridia bacterium]
MGLRIRGFKMKRSTERQKIDIDAIIVCEKIPAKGSSSENEVC